MGRSTSKPAVDEHYNVVITGGSRGIGFAMAKQFLMYGDSVVICGRSNDSLQAAVKELEQYCTGKNTINGIPADVSNAVDVENLAVNAFNNDAHGIDMWVNNAGITQGVLKPLCDTDPEEIKRIVMTNGLGTLLCDRAAINVMKKQKHGGHIFNMEGAGTRTPSATPNFATYGYTKGGLKSLFNTMQKELKGTNVKLHNMSPGIVVTDLLIHKQTTQKASTLKVFNILADRPDRVAEFLVTNARKVVHKNKSGASVLYLTTISVLWRFLTFFLRKNSIWTIVPEENIAIDNASGEKLKLE